MSRASSPSPFLEQVRAAIRVRHFSIRTEQAYVDWIRRFILFHGKRHPKDMSEREVGQFLSHLAKASKVAASTQNQALNALVFLYRAVLHRPLEEIGGVVRARKRQRLPFVLTKEETARLLRHLDGTHWLVGCLLYGAGLGLMEYLRLRVKDLDFDYRAVQVRDGKGGKDRAVTLADALLVPLKRNLQTVKFLHDKDLADGFGEVCLPYGLRKTLKRSERRDRYQAKREALIEATGTGFRGTGEPSFRHRRRGDDPKARKNEKPAGQVAEGG